MAETFPTNNANLLLDFIVANLAKVTYWHGDVWMIAGAEENNIPYFTVYSKSSDTKRTKRLYDGHSLADALWCLEHDEEYK